MFEADSMDHETAARILRVALELAGGDLAVRARPIDLEGYRGIRLCGGPVWDDSADGAGNHLTGSALYACAQGTLLEIDYLSSREGSQTSWWTRARTITPEEAVRRFPACIEALEAMFRWAYGEHDVDAPTARERADLDRTLN